MGLTSWFQLYLNKISSHDQNLIDKQKKIQSLGQEKAHLNIEILNCYNLIKKYKQNVRIKNNRLNFLYQKLEQLHAGFIRYSKKFAELYSRHCQLEQKQRDATIGRWLRKNMHYQKFIQDQEVREVALDDDQRRLTAHIPEKFVDFMVIDFNVSRSHQAAPSTTPASSAGSPSPPRRARARSPATTTSASSVASARTRSPSTP